MGTYTPMLEQMNVKAFRRFWRFVNERQLIWYRRFVEKKKAPWTKNLTLREFQFTNVYRELDRGTLYLTQQIYPACDNPKDMLFNIVIYRLFNHIPTYEFLCRSRAKRGELKPFVAGTWTWGPMARELRRWNDNGNQVFTSAFTVTGAAFAGSASKIDNISYLIEEIQHFLYYKDLQWWKEVWNAKNMKDAWDKIRKIRGFGPFLAYELVIDINYAHRRWGEDSFVNPGPGAKRGINAIYPDVHRVPDYIDTIKHLKKIQHRMLPKEFPYSDKVPADMTLRNIEHSLCEFSKYEKRRKGIRTGRARSFTPSKLPLPKRGR